jgi:hypothetical protein
VHAEGHLSAERTVLVRCDQCGKDRREDTNHWLSLRVLPAGTKPGDAGMATLIFHGCLEQGRPWRHVCGHNCASILLARWMSTGVLLSSK